MQNQEKSGPHKMIPRINKGFFSVVILIISSIITISGQEKDTFKPGGNPEVRIFSSFSTTFSDGENHNKFDLTRAYFGYNYNFTKHLAGRIVYDVADPSVGKLKFTGMLKFAYLRYQTTRLTITGGMIALPEYDFGDKRWGYRYVYKTAHDDYGFGTSADLGLSVAYNFASWITGDVTVMNGEGFKLTETDSTFKAAFGVTVIPGKNLSLRAYYDNMGKDGINQQTAEIIASYEGKDHVLSAAFNYRKNHGLIAGKDYRCISLNGAVPVSAKMKIFARYDNVTSVRVANETDPWNIGKDGQLFIAGLEFIPAPGVRFSPNFQGWRPADRDLPVISRLSLSLDLKF